MAAEQLRRMDQEEYEALPTVHAGVYPDNVYTLKTEETGWETPRSLRHAMDQYTFVAEALRFDPYETPLRGPRVNMRNAALDKMIPDVLADKADKESSRTEEDLRFLFGRFGSPEEKALVDAIIPALRRIKLERLDALKRQHAEALTESLDAITRPQRLELHKRRLSVLTMRSLYVQGARSYITFVGKIAPIDSFAVVPEPQPVADVLRFRPRIEPVVALDGEKVLLPEDTLLVAETQPQFVNA